jgi:tetratricopeptide (TPR) repeat protein
MKQEFKQALDDLVLATKESNCGPTVWSLMACCYLNLGQQTLAEEACFQGSRDAGVAPSFRRRAEYWRLNGKIDKAIEDMGRAINLDRSKYYFNFRLRASYYIQKGQLNDALADLKESLALNPGSSKTLSLLAVVESKLGKAKKAQSDIEKAFALPTLPPIVYVNRAAIELNSGMPEKALADLNHAIDQDMFLKEAYALRKTVNEKLGHTKDAEHDAQIEKKLVTHVEFFT